MFQIIFESYGASLEYVYNSNQVTVKTKNREIIYEYNPDGTLKSVTTGEGTTEYRYQDGVLAKTIFPNHTAEAITYDELRRIDVIKTVKIDPVTEVELEVLASYDYEVDAAGNREEVIDHKGRKVEYKYDELNRVIEEKITNPLDASENGRVITYTYDGVGNLDYKGDTLNGDTDFVYNSLNQLVSSTFAGVETLYTYDDNGSLKTRKIGDKTITYDWENDGENRLVGVEIVEGNERTEIEYEYNENGIRVGKTVDGVETSYLIDELQPYAQVLEEYDAWGNLQAAYTYGEDLISRNGQFYHKDGLGSTRLLTDALGGVSESYNYDAYGNLIAGNGSENPYLFAGEQRDFETGLDYLRARYYDPTLGRFISRDAYQGSLNDPMSLHKYQYAHANPVVNTDPSGYLTNLQEFAAVVGISAILSGLSWTTSTAIGSLAYGGSVSNAAAIYDQFLAGFADIVTFTGSTKLREKLHGAAATRNHRGLFFSLGRFTGGITGFSAGLGAPTVFGGTTWGQKALLGYDLFGSGLSSYLSTKKFREGTGTVWDLLAYLPLFTYASGLGLDWIATRGIIGADLAGSRELARQIPEAGLSQERFITLRQQIQNAEPWITEKARWWADLRDYMILYRGQGSLGNRILSPIAREEGLEASRALVRRMQAEGLTNAQIADFTGQWYDGPIPGYAGLPEGFQHLNGQRLGAAGIPTSAIPGVATAFAKSDDGVTMVLRLPREVPIRVQEPWDILRFEEEYIVLHQIPNSNIVQVIPAKELAPIREIQGQIQIGYR